VTGTEVVLPHDEIDHRVGGIGTLERVIMFLSIDKNIILASTRKEGAVRRSHVYSPQTLDAARVLGLRIAEGRRRRRWTQAELCERAGISKVTLRNAEHGEPTVAVGVMFELATLVGVELYGLPPSSLRDLAARERDRLALLPAHVYPRQVSVDDDF
jgi:DNA-binding XRE family transcriptional regulator